MIAVTFQPTGTLRCNGKPFIYRMIASKQIDMKTPTLATLTMALASASFHAGAAAQQADTTDTLHYSLGLGAISGPKYPGASDTRLRALPVLGATYGRFFAGATDNDMSLPLGIGYNLVQDKNWRAGVAISYDLASPRKESDDAEKLKGLGDIQRTAHIAAFGRYTNNGYSVSAAVIQSGNGQGLKIKAGADYSYALTPSLSIKGGPSLTWANEKSNQTFYGINADQSARSGRSQYMASSGFTDYTLSLGANYTLSSSWSIGAKASYSYLPGTVTDSPIVDKNSATSVAVFTAYRF